MKKILLKLFLTTLLCLSLISLFACDNKSEKRGERCRYLQKEVDDLNIEYGGQLRGKYKNVPKSLRTEIARLVKENHCKIDGDTVE